MTGSPEMQPAGKTQALGPLARRALRIGLLSFGGPAAQIALLHREYVADSKAVSEERFLNALNVCMILPGPEAQQLATYCGWIVAGTRGAMVSGLLFILPGALAMLALSALYVTHGETPVVESLFFGIKAGVLAIVLQALLRLAGRALTTASAWAIALCAFLALYLFALPFPLVIAAAALAGTLFGRGRRRSAPFASQENPPAGTTPGWRQTAARLAIGIGLWSAPAGLVLLLLPEHILLDITGFFSLMAVVSFGGAYALLSYMAQVAVETHGWLTAGQMLDGLGLAETTPGPLILVTQFVGFLGGYGQPAPFPPAIGGLLGAMMTTWVTFAPSFLAILVGAPYMERLRSITWLSDALSGITAAVVGTILNLSLWFAINVLFTQTTLVDSGWLDTSLPVPASLDPLAAMLALLAGGLLFILKRGVAEVVILAALAGIAARAAGLG